MSEKITIAVPKGRILKELEPIMQKAQIKPEPDFYDETCRKLEFNTSKPNINIIRVRSFDVATFVAFGAADIGILGNDVLDEFNYQDIFCPLDLEIGQCRLSVAALECSDNIQANEINIATKYPQITKKFFKQKGINANCIKLNGAMELAPKLGLCRNIVDLVSTGSTLKANGLVELEKIMDVSSHLIVNRNSMKTKSDMVHSIIDSFEKAIS